MVRISVALCTYNGAKYLKEQLDSLLAQTHLPCELQIGDDGSTDETIVMLDAFKRQAPFPVHVTVNEFNLGYGENFIRTAQRCSGNWIAFCDQDDIWLSHKLQRCAQLIGGGPADLALVAHNAMTVAESGEETGFLSSWPPYAVHPHLSLPANWEAHGIQLVFRSDLITAIPTSGRGLFWTESSRDAHDSWVSLMASVTGSIILTGQPLAIYRRHSANVSNLLKKPSGLREKLRPILRNNWRAYAFEAAKMILIADDLQERAQVVSVTHLREALQNASAGYERLSQTWDTRAALHREESFRARIGLFMDLLRSGSYSRSGFGLGQREVYKDIICVCLPSHLRPQ